jgi:hypothetical protein
MDLRPIQAEIESLGGELAWSTEFGVGVSFEGVSLRDSGLWELQVTLPFVVWLELTDTSITDAGLVALCAARRLEALSVDGTSISAVGLLTLRDLPKLVEITVRDTAITSEQVQWLRASCLRGDVQRHPRGSFSAWFPGISRYRTQ